MPCNYQELRINPLQIAATLCEPNTHPDRKVSLEDPAVNIMTDLTTVTAVTILPSRSLDEATDLMVRMKVKLLFVTNTQKQFIGLLTYSDLQGERPILFQQSNSVSRNEITVHDIMTGINTIEVMDWSAVETARVGDIALTMKKMNRQHALVLDHPADAARIRGIFSTSLLSKLLGMQIDTTEVAQTFAEFERVLGCSS